MMAEPALADQISAAFVYAFPLFAFAETRHRAVQDRDNPDRHAPNTIRHNRHLSDPDSLWITAPNNDTLYSNAWLDLSHGPVRVRAGAMALGRYWSLAFMDAFTNHFGVIGQRLEGTGPVDVTVLGPGQSAPPGADRVLQAPGQDAWLFCRSLVDGPADLPHAHAMQDRITVTAPDHVPDHVPVPRPVPRRPVEPANFLDVVNDMLARNPVPAGEAALLAGWAHLGLRPGGPGAWQQIDAQTRAAWSETIGPAYATLSAAGQQGRRDFGGWIAAASDIGNFGHNYPLRASVALGGLGALEPEEAMYFVRYTDQDGAGLDGVNRYLLRVPETGIPTGSFWSFTMYGYTPEGKRVLVHNPIRRYSVGNRTPGLRYNPDGSLDILLQHDTPAQTENWLPTPRGAFHISLRAYVPRPELRDGRAPLPRIERVAG